MKNQSWENIKDLFHESLERPATERDSFLRHVCDGNPEMLEEVRQLLNAFEDNQDFLETAAVGEVAELILGKPEDIEHSGQFGRYRIKSLIGEGGMGRVFLAEDTELERYAALKILSPLYSQDEDRVRRFVREAKAASSLNHPNILTIYEIGRAQDVHFIATEYIEGETLRERNHRQPLSLREILDIGVQIASALDAAHRARIIHRDVKPENIMLRCDGIVKVLDFGLAKLLAADPKNISPTARTQNGRSTAQGILLGTAAYMSPEQARGKLLDPRTDIWSCGVCFYELLSGSSPFDGETMSDVIAEILTHEPAPLPAEIPVEFTRIVSKTLQKDRTDRYQKTEEFLADLINLRDSLKDGGQIVPQTGYQTATRTIGNRKATQLSKFTANIVSGFRLYPVSLAAGILLCLTLAFAGFFLYQRSRMSPKKIAPEAARWFESGKEAAQNGNYFKAQKLLEQAVLADDQFLQAHAKLAEIQMELDFEDQAAQSLLRVTELMPQYSLNESETDDLRAILATVRRDNHSAVAAYEDAVAVAPDTTKTFAYFNLGRALEKSDASERAIEAYLETVRRDPQFAAAFLRLGIVYWHRKEEAKAIAAIDTAAGIYTANSNYDELGELFYQKGTLYNYVFNLPEAEKNFRKSLELAAATLNLPLRIKTTLALGRTAYSLGETTRAQQSIDEALQLSQSENLEKLTTNGLIDLGTLLYLKGEYEKSALYLEQALQISRTSGGKRAEARALLSLGNLALLRVRPAEAVRYIEPALKYYRANDFRQEKSQALLALGYAYDQSGSYAPAIELLEELLNRAKEENDQPMTAHAESAIGLALIHAERFSEALERCENSYRINQSLGLEQIAAYALLNKAQSLIFLGRFREAREALRQTSEAADKSRDRQLIAWVHLMLAKAALFEGQGAKAVNESRKSLEISGEQVDEIVISANTIAAAAELRGGSRAKAGDYLQIAGDAGKKIENARLLSDVKLVQSEFFLEGKNAPEALQGALQACAHFAERQTKYSEWRALAIAAQASRKLGDLSAAQAYARQSKSVFALFEQVWGAENFESFKNRSDTIFYQSLIDEVLSEK